jgi:hypothetical protein
LSEQLQLRRGTAAQIASAAAPTQGEPWVDTTNNRIVIGDGTTVGGWAAAKLAEVLTNNRIAVGDANYTVQTTDRMVAYTTLTASRVVTLPAASAYPVGTPLRIVDESGSCSPSVTITIQAAGSDLIDGVPTDILSSQYAFTVLESNGAAKWTIVGQPAGTGAGVLAVASGGSGVSPKALHYTLAALGVNCNTVADTLIAVTLPAGLTRYRVARITVLNCSIPLSAAQAGVYTSAAAGGAVIAAPQTLAALTSNAPNAAGNAFDLTLNLPPATFFTSANLYFRVTTPQGAAATVDCIVDIGPYD